ncbi:MAG: aspartate--tRNA ligase [Oscillospiraceae bacterium]|jgi:aspartyl-tRNA synthetase|nr:aspartate--tRNA ligase [Oscillospiraceae bacterium]
MLRTHTCGELRLTDAGETARLSGWVDTIRDHGGVKFLDLRDETGVTQIVVHDDAALRGITRESVISAAGTVRPRDAENVNPALSTGSVELFADSLELLGAARAMLPFEIGESTATREEVRLRYRYLDLRNPEVHANIRLRAEVIKFLRERMDALGFTEIQTPILTASSPEGARDFIVPSRKHKGRFYALPQAPQQFKQLLMVAGFDRYYQIAPCFRDEDARFDRSPGEFYQLDFEMSFAEQEDVLAVGESVLYDTFTKFGGEKRVSPRPFPRITYRDAMLRYGTDKPDLRNPLEICDLTDFFANAGFAAFRGKPVRGVAADCSGRPRSFFDASLKYAQSIGMAGLGYLTYSDGQFRGPIEKFLSPEQKPELIALTGLSDGETLFFISDALPQVNKYAGQIRTWLGENLGLIGGNAFEFCFVVDIPMYEPDEETGQPAFMHNPFSLPHGGLEALQTQNPLDILAYQYDVVCNGVELTSGAVRNTDTELMKAAFAIAGYDGDEVERRFGALYTAFSYGAPPHAGMAPGVDRILMMLTGAESIREVVAFPLNSEARDILLGAPGEVTEAQLRDVHIKLR